MYDGGCGVCVNNEYGEQIMKYGILLSQGCSVLVSVHYVNVGQAMWDGILVWGLSLAEHHLHTIPTPTPTSTSSPMGSEIIHTHTHSPDMMNGGVLVCHDGVPCWPRVKNGILMLVLP